MTATQRALELTHFAAEAAADKLAHDILAFDVSEQLALTDVFLIVSGANDRQVRAIVDEIQDKLLERDTKVVRREGEREGRWVLLDYGDIIVHVQHDEDRAFYALERIWGDCPTISLPEIGDAAGKAPVRRRESDEAAAEFEDVPLAGEPPAPQA